MPRGWLCQYGTGDRPAPALRLRGPPQPRPAAPPPPAEEPAGAAGQRRAITGTGPGSRRGAGRAVPSRDSAAKDRGEEEELGPPGAGPCCRGLPLPRPTPPRGKAEAGRGAGGKWARRAAGPEAGAERPPGPAAPCLVPGSGQRPPERSAQQVRPFAFPHPAEKQLADAGAVHFATDVATSSRSNFWGSCALLTGTSCPLAPWRCPSACSHGALPVTEANSPKHRPGTPALTGLPRVQNDGQERLRRQRA